MTSLYQAKLSRSLSADRQPEDDDNITLGFLEQSQVEAHVQANRDTAGWGVTRNILDPTILLCSRDHNTAAEVAKSTGRVLFLDLLPSLFPEYKVLPYSCHRQEGGRRSPPEGFVELLMAYNLAKTDREFV